MIIVTVVEDRLQNIKVTTSSRQLHKEHTVILDRTG